MKQIKTMGLTIAMVMALTALLGAASASASQFRAEEYPTTVTGAQVGQQTITLTTGKKLTCQTATTSGTIAEASSALTLTPAFSGCKLFGSAATVSANSCKYVLHSTNEKAPYTGTIDVACSKEGDAIEAVSQVFDCQVKFPAQSALGSVEFTNTGKRSRSRTITVTLNVAGLKYIKAGTECSGSGTHEDGTITGSSVVKGVNEKAEHAVGIYVANEQVESVPLFEGEEYPLNIKGEQLSSMNIGLPIWGQLGCTTTTYGVTKFSGSATELSQSVENWEGCASIGKVNMNGCYFTFHAVTSEAPVADGTMGIACSGGSSITFLVKGVCEVSIPAQSGLNSLHFENTGTGAARAITVHISVSKLKYTEVNAECSKKGTHEDGTLSGTVAIKGYQYSGIGLLGPQKGLWVE